MSAAAKTLADSLGCSELIARELLTTGLELAKRLRDLADVFTYEHMLVAKRTAATVYWAKDMSKQTPTYGLQAQKARLEAKARTTRRKLSSPARQMFKRFETANAAWEKFNLARHGVAELRGQANEELLTATLTCAHEHRQLPQPEKVVLGRQVYQAMMRDTELLRDVAALPMLDL